MNPLDWSMKLFRVAGIEVRAHWSLFLMALIEAMLGAQHGGALIALAFGGLLFLSVLLHEFGHAFGARAVGGDCRTIVLWALGGLAHADAPMRPLPQFVVAAAGPLVSGVIAAAAFATLAIHDSTGVLIGLPTTAVVIERLAWMNVVLLVFNLIPVHPFDGGHIFRAALWPWIGLRRATLTALFLGYPAAFALMFWGGWHRQWMVLLIGAWVLLRVVQEHTLVKLGQVVEQEHWTGGGPSREGWFGRWRRERARKAQARRDREEQDEQEIIDRLLAKVGSDGLAALTKQERATLEAYSRKQREKQEIGR
ncbi:MAG TPA: M50 family metallopeptidase [Planctomycetota bacterium]|nr:M50 family metallopeptidase [Planctomycetota bacterium]